MTDHIHIDRHEVLFRIDIDMPMSSKKAQDIKLLIEEDAGEASVELAHRKRMIQLRTKGLVTPMTMRHVLDVLAQ